MTQNRLRIVFMGTPDFSVPALKALCESGHEVVAVYSQPPRPKGRGQQVQLSPVHAYAQERGIPVYNPLSLKKAPEQAEFAALNADVAVVAAYGLILPQVVLDAPKYGCINIHASLLPRWRGASPIQQAIWKGDKQSGVVIMQMELGLDTGPVIAERSAEITPLTTASSLHDALSALGGEMIIAVMDDLARAQERLPATVQDDALTTYAPLLKKEDGQVNWTQSAAQIDCQIRALNPWPGVQAHYDGRRVKILEAAPVEDETTSAAAGTILNRQGHVACGEGTVLRLVKIQPENAKAMDFISAVNGGYIHEGGVLA